jgi:hypothetical protein
MNVWHDLRGLGPHLQTHPRRHRTQGGGRRRLSEREGQYPAYRPPGPRSGARQGRSGFRQGLHPVSTSSSSRTSRSSASSATWSSRSPIRDCRCLVRAARSSPDAGLARVCRRNRRQPEFQTDDSVHLVGPGSEQDDWPLRAPPLTAATFTSAATGCKHRVWPPNGKKKDNGSYDVRHANAAGSPAGSFWRQPGGHHTWNVLPYRSMPHSLQPSMS